MISWRAQACAWKSCASSTSAPDRARCCWRCSANCRRPSESAPTSARRRWRRARQCRAPWSCRPLQFRRLRFRRGLAGPFDLIVSNPPYVARGDIATLAPEVRDYDPAIALDGGADGLDAYRAIAGAAKRLLAPGGRLIVELGMGQEPAVRALFTKAGLTAGAARKDLAGIPRALGARYRAMKRTHFDPSKSAGLVYGEKSTWIVPRKRLASRQRNRPVTIVSPKTPEQRLCAAAARRRMTSSRSRRQTKSPDTGPDASPVGRIKLLSLDDARNEKIGNAAGCDRGHGVAATIAIKNRKCSNIGADIRRGLKPRCEFRMDFVNRRELAGSFGQAARAAQVALGKAKGWRKGKS